MAFFAIRDATGVDYCATIAGRDYEPAFRKHAAWWEGYMRHASADTRKKYNGGHKGMPCFPVRVVIED